MPIALNLSRKNGRGRRQKMARELRNAGKSPFRLMRSRLVEFCQVRIGCAGWSIPRAQIPIFGTIGSHLKRYGQVLNAVEINSSFYRSHKESTYARWADTVPPGFQFSLKLPKAISHEHRLIGTETLLDRFLSECRMLGPKLGPLLLQLPPSLNFDSGVAASFFRAFRSRFDGEIACEPRHESWFTAKPDCMLSRFRIVRVAADPAVTVDAGNPGGAADFVYFRLHGSPEIYHSCYSDSFLHTLRLRVEHFATAGVVWCIFDNTALGAATPNALNLVSQLRGIQRQD